MRLSKYYSNDELAAAYAILCQYGAHLYDDEVYEIEEWISAIGLDVAEVYSAYSELVASGYHGCGRKSANPARSKKTTRSKKTKEVPTEAPTDIEYVIWGVPPGEEYENVLHTRSKSMAEAQKIIKILETEHGCTKCHVQVLDLTKPPDFSGVLNNPEMTESEFGDYFRKDVLRQVAYNEESYGPINIQARRQAWDDVVAALIRERKFPERRSLPDSATDWPYPEWLGTVRFVRRTGAEAKRKKSGNPSDLTWYENDDGSWDGEFWSMRVAKVRYAEAGEVEGGLGALARYMTASRGGAQAPPSPEGWYWQGTEQQGVWSHPRLASSAVAAKRAAEKALQGYFEKKRVGNPSVHMKRMMNPRNY